MRYGSIRYVNNLPVDHGLATGNVAAPPGLQIIDGTPQELNRALRRGKVDVSAVSAAMLLSETSLQILPEATIASHGPVDSVLLVSERPFDELEGRHVAVSEESATGALLARIILERDVGVHPTYKPMRSDLEGMLREADAALLIGDDALRVSAGRQGVPGNHALDGFEVLDLGEAWRAYSGLPMVYALWVARPAVPEEPLSALRQALAASRDWGAAHKDLILEEAQRRTQVPEIILRTYYERLTHTLGPREADGLRRFLDEAAALDHQQAPTVHVPTVEVVS